MRKMKYYFLENITFWAGPAVRTSDPVKDMFPSDNGFFLRPIPMQQPPVNQKEKVFK